LVRSVRSLIEHNKSVTVDREFVHQLVGCESRTIRVPDDRLSRKSVVRISCHRSFLPLKRAIIGAYHQVSHKHLDAYLDELEWRFSNRRNPHLFRDTIANLLKAEAMPFKKLTA